MKPEEAPDISPPIAALVDAEVTFDTADGRLQAVAGVTLEIRANEAVGLVGESGSGKSTTAAALLGLQKLAVGRLYWGGQDVGGWSERRKRPWRRHIQPVLQDARAALNPRLTLGTSIAEPMAIHNSCPRAVRDERVLSLLEAVGLEPEFADRYPAHASGGQLQRATIARALACDPQLLVLDEPISALDVSVAAKVLRLLAHLRRQRRLSYLFIAHDLPAVAEVCDRVVVMYLGRVVETGPASEVLARPLHPYTRALVDAVPTIEKSDWSEALVLAGDPPSPLDPPSGCALHPRCPMATAKCAAEVPNLRAFGEDRAAACWVDPPHGTAQEG